MKKYIATLIALSAILSCDVREAAQTPQELEAPQREEGVMYFEPMYPGSTKATETAFEQGDVIGLYVTDYQGETAPPLQISGNWANNVSATFDGTSWLTSKKIFWGEGLMDVYGGSAATRPATSSGARSPAWTRPRPRPSSSSSATA